MNTKFDPNAKFADREYVNSNFASKIANVPGVKFLADVKALWEYLKDAPPAAHVAVILFALGYFIFPFDAIPDGIPVAGYADDALVITAAVSSIGSALAKYRR